MTFLRLSGSGALELWKSSIGFPLSRPYAKEGIKAGFPSPADDFLDLAIDLNEELVKNPAATFYGRVRGNSMREEGIEDGDLLVIDRSIEPKNGMVAVCYIDGEFTVKRIKIEKDCCWLIPANPDYSPIRVNSKNDFLIWGIVIHLIKSL